MLAILYLLFTVSLQYMVEICCHQPSREWRLAREPCLDLGMVLRSEAKRLTKAIDVFVMFFTAEVVNRICVNTNKYAWTQILKKQSYAEADGS